MNPIDILRKLRTGSCDRETRRAVEAMIDDFANIANATKAAMDETCDANERHCTCVPALRREVKRLEAVIRLAGRKLAEYAQTGEDGHYMINILLREAAQAAKEQATNE